LARFRSKAERVTHFAIPSPKTFAPLSSILLPLRCRLKEVRVTHVAIPFPNYFAPLSPMLFQLRLRSIESINRLGVSSSFFINCEELFAFIETLSTIGSYNFGIFSRIGGDS